MKKKQIVKSVTQSENSGKQLDDVDRGDKKIIFFRWWNFKEKKYKEFSIHSSSPILNFFFFYSYNEEEWDQWWGSHCEAVISQTGHETSASHCNIVTQNCDQQQEK